MFGRKEPKARLIQPGQISLSGMELENAVRNECGFDIDWELQHMQAVLLWLMTAHFTVALTTCRSGWACSIAKGDILTDDGDYVREFGNESPAVAVARACLAAQREWGVGC